MTLFNIDKNSDGRGEPVVNAADVLLGRKAHATDSISPRAQGTQGAAKITTKNSRIIANDGTNNIGLFGFDDAGRMVVKVAKPGYDANTATNDQLIFNSAQNVFKIVGSGTGTTVAIFGGNPGAGNFNTLNSSNQVAHNLGYIPAVVAYALYAGGTSGVGYTLMPNTFFSGTGTTASWTTLTCTADSQYVYFQASTTLYGNAGASLPSISIKYYLLQESAA